MAFIWGVVKKKGHIWGVVKMKSHHMGRSQKNSRSLHIITGSPVHVKCWSWTSNACEAFGDSVLDTSTVVPRMSGLGRRKAQAPVAETSTPQQLLACLNRCLSRLSHKPKHMLLRSQQEKSILLRPLPPYLKRSSCLDFSISLGTV